MCETNAPTLSPEEFLQGSLAWWAPYVQEARTQETFSAASDRVTRAFHVTGNEEVLRHSLRVGLIGTLIAEQLHLPPSTVQYLQEASLLHDVGKVTVPRRILRAPRRLTYAEWELIRAHPSIAYEIVRQVPALEHTARLIRGHHERLDGTGYPDGLSGDQLPLETRILSLADALDAMLSARPYRVALRYTRILEELRAHAGTQFDAELVAVVTRGMNAILRHWARITGKEEIKHANQLRMPTARPSIGC